MTLTCPSLNLGRLCYDRSDIMLLLGLDDRRQYKFCLVLFRHLLWSSATMSSGGGTEAPGSSPIWATADSKDQPGSPVMGLQMDAQPPWSCPSDAMRNREAEPARLCPKGRFLSKINECYFKPPSLELVCNTDRKQIYLILLHSFTQCIFNTSFRKRMQMQGKETFVLGDILWHGLSIRSIFYPFQFSLFGPIFENDLKCKL